MSMMMFMNLHCTILYFFRYFAVRGRKGLYHIHDYCNHRYWTILDISVGSLINEHWLVGGCDYQPLAVCPGRVNCNIISAGAAWWQMLINHNNNNSVQRKYLSLPGPASDVWSLLMEFCIKTQSLRYNK